MAWVLLVLAIAAEVVGTLSLKASDGFSKLWPSVTVVLGYGLAFTLLAFALKTLDVGQHSRGCHPQGGTRRRRDDGDQHRRSVKKKISYSDQPDFRTI